MNSRFGLQIVTGRISNTILTLLLAVTALSLGCGSSEPPPTDAKKSPPKAIPSATASPSAEATPTAPAAMKKWDRPIVCQPHLKKADGTDAHQGTGFFVRAPSGKLAAVSSAHFLDFEGSPVVEAAWLRYTDMEPMAKFTTSWGTPGREGNDENLTTDYWIMPVAEDEAKAIIDKYEVLEFDPRPRPENGERVWLPNKDQRASLGFMTFGGRILIAGDGMIAVELDGNIKLQSQSGSPVISRQTHQVIGTLSSGAEQNGKTFLWLAPVAKMRAVLADETNFPALKTVIGKATAP